MISIMTMTAAIAQPPTSIFVRCHTVNFFSISTGMHSDRIRPVYIQRVYPVLVLIDVPVPIFGNGIASLDYIGRIMYKYTIDPDRVEEHAVSLNCFNRNILDLCTARCKQ